MNTNLIAYIFENDKFIRSFLGDDSEPRFVGVDACRILDYANSRQALDRLDSDERGVCSIDTPGGAQEMIVVTEAGLYRLIFGSRKPVAERFKRWLAHEVLPSIRKTGGYQTDRAKTQKAETAGMNAVKNMMGELRRTMGVRAAAKAAPALLAKIGVNVADEDATTLDQGELDLGDSK